MNGITSRHGGLATSQKEKIYKKLFSQEIRVEATSEHKNMLKLSVLLDKTIVLKTEQVDEMLIARQSVIQLKFF